MAYDLIYGKVTPKNRSRQPVDSSSGMGGPLSTAECEALMVAGEKVRKAGLYILGGLALVSVAEIVAHRNMSFTGEGFLHQYKLGRGVKQG